MDINDTIKAKSDQLNSDDLIGGSITITITAVTVAAGDQPVSIHYEGDGGKPYKPSKGMRRVLVHLWGNNSKDYVGKSLTLYREDSITFGGVAVGGIRISHASHIAAPATMALTTSKTKRTPITVQPLAAKRDPLAIVTESASRGTEALKAAFESLSPDEKRAVKPSVDELKKIAETNDK